MLELVIDRRRRDLGGFEVGRVLPFGRRRMVGPFIFFDHLGPVTLPPGLAASADVRPHPHIGLSTVTYLFAGEIVHRDSVGSESVIRPGELNWMVAGRGITHSERFEKARAQGDTVHAIQSWVALPAEEEESDPSFAHYGQEELPTFEADGAWARLIAGQAFGMRSPARTHSPMFYLHWVLNAGATIKLPQDYRERAAYIVSGRVSAAGQTFEEGQMLVFSRDSQPVLSAITPALVMAVGGDPLGERFIEWNFVSASQERIRQAKADWRAGRMKLPDLDNREFIPLPPDPSPAPSPM